MKMREFNKSRQNQSGVSLKEAPRFCVEALETRCLLADILGAASTFAVLGASTVTNVGGTAIVGDVGVSPGAAITGLSPSVVTGGAIHDDDALASQAHSDLVTAYGDITGEVATSDLTGTDLGGLTLTPGVYHFDTSAALTGTLTLNAEGDPDARFDFQIGTTLIAAANSAVDIINDGQADNVYFQVGTSATLAAGTAFEGNILADQSITLASGASFLDGRALALNAAVTMSDNQIAVPQPANIVTTPVQTQADLSVTNTTATGPVLAGNAITYTVTVANAGPSDAQAVAMSELVPTGTTFISDTQTSGPTFTLTNPAVGGTGTISDTIGTLASGASASFTVVVLIAPDAADGATITNTASVSTATTDPNTANNSQTATTTVQSQPDISVTNTTAATFVLAGDTIAYTVTVANAGPSDAQTVDMTELIPVDTTFVSDTQISGPAFALANPAVGGTGTISDTIGTLASGASASFTIVVRVSPSTPDGATITSTANVSSAIIGSEAENDSRSISIGVGLTRTTPTIASVMSPLSTPSARPTLSILGADTASLGEAGLTYTWSVAHAPSGAGPVKFSINGTNSAKDATVRVEKAGTYVLDCVITNSIGNSVTAPVELVIKQVATRLQLEPHAQTIAAGAKLQYGSIALDQFGHAMRTTPTVKYAVKSGDGSIDSAGLFTAGQFQSHVVIEITDDGLEGTVGATVL